MEAGRVVACSPPARSAGVVPGLRLREAESRCAGLVAVEHDPLRDARAFEPVVEAVEERVPAVDVLRPGAIAFHVHGPTRYYGGEPALVRVIVEAAERASGLGARAGIAEGIFAAEQAARRNVIVPHGRTVEFLATLPVSVLARALDDFDLPNVLQRLGLATLGDLAALPSASVADRFGARGVAAQRLAQGESLRPVVARQPPPDLVAVLELDPPADRIDAVAFAARILASDLGTRLAAAGLACAHVAIEAETTSGETLARRWRNDAGFDPETLAERVRWQLEGWLTAQSVAAPALPGARAAAKRARVEGLRTLRLAPCETFLDRGAQLSLGRSRAGEERIDRTLARVQGLLGDAAVRTAVIEGGRTERARIRLVPWGETRTTTDAASLPWPGRTPSPSPATVYHAPRPAELIDARGEHVHVSGRGIASAEPARLSINGARTWMDVSAWAGPWPIEERWWDASARTREARWQVLTEDGDAYLLALRDGRWWVDGTYD
jgi:protein ImuB